MAQEQQLVDYIKKAREAGQSDIQSKALLSKNGWTDVEVAEAMTSLSQPLPQAQPQPQPQQEPKPEVQVQPQPKIEPVVQPQTTDIYQQNNTLRPGKSHIGMKLIIVLIILVALGGVGYVALGQYLNLPWNPFVPNPSDVTNKMLQNMTQVKSSKSITNGEIIINNNDIQMGKLSFNFSGGTDAIDINNPKGNYNMSFSLISPTLNPSASLAADIINLSKTFYVKVNSISAPENIPFSQVNKDNIIGKWIKIDQNSINTLSQLQGGQMTIPDISQSTSSDLAKKIQDLIASENIFLVDKQLSNETISGQNTYHYLVKITKEKLGSLVDKIIALEMQEVAKTQPENSSPLLENMARAATKTFVDAIGDISMELWIGQNDYMLYGVKFDKTFDIANVVNSFGGSGFSGNNMRLSIKIDSKYSDFNKPIVVQEPADSQKIEDVIMPMLYSSPVYPDMKKISSAAESLYIESNNYSLLCRNGFLNGSRTTSYGLEFISAVNSIIKQGAKNPICFAGAQDYCVSTQLLDGSYLCINKNNVLGKIKCTSYQTICQ